MTRTRIGVAGAPIDALDMGAAVETIAGWAEARESRTVCLCNVHSVVTARGDAALAKAIVGADLALPDGAPVAWLMRRLGRTGQRRVTGPDLMRTYFGVAARRCQPVYLYGSSEATLLALQEAIRREHPQLVVAGAWSPPFRTLTQDEDDEVVARINNSGAVSVWVALGCPRQEAWIAAHRGRIRAVLVGVGAAFDFHAGTIRRAPPWMQRIGLEWLHRMASEPKRLWKRYLVTNSIFVVLAGLELLDLARPAASRGDK